MPNRKKQHISHPSFEWAHLPKGLEAATRMLIKFYDESWKPLVFFLLPLKGRIVELTIMLSSVLNPLSANPTKRSNTFKQFVQMDCLSVLDQCVGLALKGLIPRHQKWESNFPAIWPFVYWLYKIGWLCDFKGTRVWIYIVFVIIYLYQYRLTYK